MLGSTPRPLTQGFHAPPDRTAVQRRFVFRKEHAAGGDTGFFHIAQQEPSQRGGNEDHAGFPLVADGGAALPHRLGGDVPQLGDSAAAPASGSAWFSYIIFSRCCLSPKPFKKGTRSRKIFKSYHAHVLLLPFFSKMASCGALGGADALAKILCRKMRPTAGRISSISAAPPTYPSMCAGPNSKWAYAGFRRRALLEPRRAPRSAHCHQRRSAPCPRGR